MAYYLANDRASACSSKSHYGAFPMEDLGQDISGTLQGAGGIGGLLSVTKSDGTYFPFADANGNITEYVDTNGTIVAHYEFDPYGNVTVATGDKTGEFAFRFSSKPWDDETGLGYWGYRWLQDGRWLSRDPLGEDWGGNLYQFVGNDPVGQIDWLGLEDVFKYLDFRYKDSAGKSQELTASTKASDVQLEYNYPGGGGLTDLQYDSSQYSDSSKYSESVMSRDICRISLRLQIRLNKMYEGKGDSYKDPTAATVVYYIKHWGTQSSMSGFAVVPAEKDLNAHIVKTHERGHAQGIIDELFKHGMAAEIDKAIDWGKAVPLVVAGNEAAIAKLVNSTVNGVMNRDEFSQIDMKAADQATIGIFHARAKWKESEKDAHGFDIKWSFSP